MEVKTILNIGIEELKQANIENPHFEAELLLSYVAKIPKEKILINNFKLDEYDANKFFELINKRKRHYPLQYIIGEWEFWSISLLIEEGIFIPRPETETLIDLVLQNKHLNFASVIDIGTGSGNIAIALAKEISNIFIIAIDVSEKALELAKKNAEINNVSSRIKFIQSDLLSGINLNSLNQPILIISNPPYISISEAINLQEEIRLYEPRFSYLADEDGLEYYIKIARQASNFKNNFLYLLFEIPPHRKDKIIGIFNEFNFIFLEEKKDLSGKSRAILFKSNDIYEENKN